MTSIIPFTADGMEKIKAEKETLLLKRKDKVDSLRIAREMGDLSENAAYKIARMELSSLDSRVRYLSYLIRAGKVQTSPIIGKIGIGSKITILQDNKNLAFEIVGSFESNPAKGKISHLSPLGKALMGKAAEDKITVSTPGGSNSYKIISVKN
ncbi:hypothetical protein A2W14_07500 [Candidatus Gottesmanbacteria bacterium RBG_16_37_8]|uniref:Transcription elongation factor GreA n=1 Tax=Candidatus Gottesmanbacteria bacterium RBG_16_37_8 TaxID=1798371 RepID=A0A1F5YTI8_9BACT|nr:MAG: hypothetical protein A2W14_07500 [Candidatus Gottesmanbacteria bacterium RBG_16_37_8]